MSGVEYMCARYSVHLNHLNHLVQTWCRLGADLLVVRETQRSKQSKAKQRLALTLTCMLLLFALFPALTGVTFNMIVYPAEVIRSRMIVNDPTEGGVGHACRKM